MAVPSDEVPPGAVVCVIDGDPAVRDSLATLMSLNGHRVLTFGGGDEFFETGCEAPVACVICEAELPDVGGLELFRRFKAEHPTTRFALLTSRSDRAIAAAALRCGVDAVFHKPLVHRRLTRFVESVLLV